MTHKNEHLNVNSIRNSIDSISNDKNSFGISATSCYQSSSSSSSISSSSQTIINNQSSMMITQSSQLNKSSNGSNGTTNINKRVSSGSKYSNSFAKNVTGSTGSSSKQSGGKKTKGRVKIKMEFIDNKLRRYTTFSKRKTGIMKKAYELSTLTGTQVMLLVASETGHVYTFATRKLQPMITSDAGKALIQTCLNSPDTGQISGNQNNSNDVIITTNGHSHANLNELCYDDTSNELNQQRSLATGNPHHPHHHNHHHHHQAEIHGRSLGSNSSVTTSNSHLGVNNNNNNNNDSNTNNNNGTVSSNDQRMSATGFEETELSYSVSTNTPQDDKNTFRDCSNLLTNGNHITMITSREEFLTKNPNYSNDSRLINQRDDFLTLNQNDFIHNLPLNDNDDDDDEDEEEEEDEVDEDKDDVNHSDQFDCWRFHSEDIKSLADHNQLKLSSKFDSDQTIFDRFGNSRSNFKEKTTKRISENFSKSLPLKSRPNEKIKSRPPRLKNRIETQLNKTSKFDEKTSTISRKQSVSNRTNIFHYDSKGFKEIKSNFGDEDHSSNIRAETYLNFDSNRFDWISGEEFGQNLTTIRSGGQSSTNLSAFSESSLSNQTNHLKAKSKSSKSKTNRSLKSKGSIIRTPLNATKSNSLGLGHNATDCNGISNSLLSLLPNNEDNLEKILSESYQSTSRISTSCASQQNSKTSSVISSLISNKINKTYINENLNNSIAHNSNNSVPFPLTTPLSIKHSDRSMIPKQSIQISNLDSDFVNVSLSTNQSESINFSTTNVDRPSITFPSDSFATQNLQLQTMATLAARQFLSSGSTLSYPYLNLNDPLSSKLSSIQDDNTLSNKFFRSSDTLTTSNSNMASSIDSDTTANQNLSKNWWKRNGNL